MPTSPVVRCGTCQAFASRDVDGEPICCNTACGDSWQVTMHSFETSLLGIAVRDALRVARRDAGEL